MAGVDSFFGFLDKHLKEVSIGVGALILLASIKKNQPDSEQQKADQEARRDDVNQRLIPPAAPVRDKDGRVSRTDEVAYNARLKAHRSAKYAAELYDHMHTGRVSNLVGVNADKVLKTAYNISLARITLPQLEADYLAQQAESLLFVRSKLADDLRHTLSSTDYLEFMRRIGLTPAQTYAITQPKPKK